MKSTLLALVTLVSSFAHAQLALNWKPEPQFGGFYQAEAQGLFKKAGLDPMPILEGGSGTPTVQMLANGKVEFAVVSAEEILINNERNPTNKVVGVFAVFQTNPQMIMCHEEAGFKTLADVYASSSTLALQSGLTYAQYLKNKFPKAKVKQVPYLGGVTNFLADKKFCQQGFITSEPLTAEKAGAKPKAFLVAYEGFNPYTTVVAVREETLKTKAERVKKMADVLKAAWENYVSDPTLANAHMAKLNKAMDAETFRKSAEAQKALISTADTKKAGLGTMTSERWTTLAHQLKELGVIKNDSGVAVAFKNF